MLKFVVERLGWVVTIVVVVAFFLPWLKTGERSGRSAVSPEQTREEMVEEADQSWMETYFTLRPNEVQDALFHPLAGTSGCSLLLLARSDRPADQHRARKMVSFLGSTESREAAVLIYAIPAFVLIGICMMVVAADGRGIFLLPCAMCAGLYFFMRGRLSETYLDRSVLELAAGLGLWISLYGLLSMAGLLGLRAILGWSRK